MNNYYKEDYITQIKKKVKTQKIIILIMMIFVIALDTTLIILSNSFNKSLMKVLTVSITTLIVWYIMLSYSLVIRNSKFQINHISQMLHGNAECYTGTIKECTNDSLRSFDIKTKEVIIESGGTEHPFNFELMLGDVPFKNGDKVKLYVTDKYIVYSEEMNDEI